MKHLRYLLMAALVAMPLTACDDDDGGDVIAPPATGTVSGTVSAEGDGLAGVSVTLVGATSQSATTGSGGSFSFTNVEAGSYGVSISDVPAGVSFSTTAKTTSITTDGQTVTVDFSGSYIRTSTIAGQVVVDGAGIAGIAVTATGPEGAKNAVTDNGGNYSFSGLRAGDYAVAISNVPAEYTFSTMSYDITLGTGEAKTASFFGALVVTEDPVTANVMITSVTTGATNVPVNPNNVAGQIDVSLQVDPGENDLTKLTLLLDGVEVASQTFSSAVAASEIVEKADGVFTVVFSVNTAEFDMATGVPSYLNGTHQVSAVLGLANAQEASVSTTVDLTFNNADTFIGEVVPAQSAIGANGLLYYGGDLVATILPVAYSGKTVNSVTVTFSNLGVKAPAAQGPFAAVAPNLSLTDAAAPFELTFSSGATGPLNNYQTAAASVGAETMRVTAALYNDGTVFNMVPLGGSVTLTGGATMAVDNVVPQIVGPDGLAATADDLILALPNQVFGATHPVSSANNWVWPDFQFADADLSTATATTRDNTTLNVGGPGVGGVVTTYHMGDATQTVAQVAALPAVATPGETGLGPSLVNTAYRPVMVLTDALGNATWVSLTNSTDNPGAPLVGHDAAAPTSQAVAAPGGGALFLDNLIFNAASLVTPAVDGLAFTAVEDRAGFSATPVRMELKRVTAANTRYPIGASFTAGGLVNEIPTINVCAAGVVPSTGANALPFAGPCLPAKDALGIGTATNTNAYYTLMAHFVDQAGNEVATDVTRQWLLDDILPTTNNVSIPSSTLVGGAATSFGFQVADNLDLWSVNIGFDFAGSGVFIPFGEDVMVGDGDRWDDAVVTSASGIFTFPFVRALETAPAGAPAGVANAATNVRAVTMDAANNQSVAQTNNFAAATVPAGTPFAGLTTWTVPAPAAAFNLCNGQGGVACPTAAGNGKSVVVTTQATGASGTYPNPFANGSVYFYYVIDPTPAGYYSGDEEFFLAGSVDGTSATFTDTGAVRTYSWSFTYTSDIVAAVPGGTAITLVAIGTSSNGDAILSFYNTNVTVINGT